MALPVSFHTITYNDNTLKSNGSPETTTISLPITTLTPANVAAQTALITALENAITDILLGQKAKSETVYTRAIISGNPAGSTLAQRENKWLMRYHGVTLNEKFQASVGTTDLTLLPTGSEFLDLTAGEGLTLKTAFEAIVKSPGDAAESVVLDSVQFVGRNS